MTTFLNREKAAELLGISERTFERRYVYTGLVPAIRFNRSDREKSNRNIYLRRDVEKALVAKRKAQP